MVSESLEITSKGKLPHFKLFIHSLTQSKMEKTLIKSNRITLKFMKNTVLFGISYDKPDLYIACLFFVVEIKLHKSKGPKTF
jgi:hypothetical protein